jgi:hypothetical protein
MRTEAQTAGLFGNHPLSSDAPPTYAALRVYPPPVLPCFTRALVLVPDEGRSKGMPVKYGTLPCGSTFLALLQQRSFSQTTCPHINLVPNQRLVAFRTRAHPAPPSRSPPSRAGALFRQFCRNPSGGRSSSTGSSCRPTLRIPCSRMKMTRSPGMSMGR